MDIAKVNKNKAFLRNIYMKGPFQGHGFCVKGYSEPIFTDPAGCYTLSSTPLKHGLPWAVKNYRNQLDCFEKVDHDGVPLAHLTTGTHIYAAAFGCKVHTFPDNNPCAVPFVNSPEEADKVEEPDIWKSPTIYRIFELGAALKKELGQDVDLGPCDMQTGFDTAALVWNKEDMFCSMFDPEGKEAVKRLVDKCARFFKTVMIELRKEFPTLSPDHCPWPWCPPELAPWASNDECGALSPEMFEEFCMPEILDLSATFGGFGMHCCAAAEHQFPSFMKIPNFYAFNRVQVLQSPKGVEDIFPVLAGPHGPVHVIGWQTLEQFEALIRKAPEGTRFIFDVTPCTFAGVHGSYDESRRIVERLRKLSPRQDG